MDSIRRIDFCGISERVDRDLFMSQAAADALRPSSRSTLESRSLRIHSTELDELVKAGGSLRCMVARIF